MSDSHAASGGAAQGVFAGIGAACVVGAAIGAVTAMSSWSIPESAEGGFGSSLANALRGAWVGGVASLVAGSLVAWHGGSLGAGGIKLPTAPLWGLIPGALMGASLMPIFCVLLGITVNQAIPALWLGIVLGPIVGIAAWEVSFLFPQFRGSR